jgi:hypothetical protein
MIVTADFEHALLANHTGTHRLQSWSSEWWEKTTTQELARSAGQIDQNYSVFKILPFPKPATILRLTTTTGKKKGVLIEFW